MEVSDPSLSPSAMARATSVGRAQGHAGEILQGALDAPQGRRRVLLSMPSPQLTSNAEFFESATTSLRVEPAWKRRSLESFRLACQALRGGAPEGLLRMNSNIPAARGLGSSTADCAAAMRAAAAWLGAELPNDRLASLVHRVERFSDSSIFDDELVLFRHDAGLAQERLPGPSPRLRMLLVEDAAGARQVETSLLPRPVYNDGEMRLFAMALRELRRIVRHGDASGLAAVAELSAEINQRHHPQTRRTELLRLTRAAGALGLGATHSGDLQIVFFADDDSHAPRRDFIAQRLPDIGLRPWRELASL